MTSHVFLTGVTGFIGRSLLQKWMDSLEVRFHLLARSKHELSPRVRIKQILRELYPDADVGHFTQRIEVVEGDVSLDRFGLQDSDYKQLSEKVSHIIHCAAAARFDLELEEARQINVKGTENVLALARECPGLKKIDYIGTAYVAGRRRGVIGEDELDEGQQHNNTYEKSKLEAEKLVRGSWSELPITIFRPSIVICDANTGRVSSHSAFYRVLKMYLQGRLPMLPGNPSCLLDLVPVDYMADATYLISQERNSSGKCYHLTAGLNNLTTLEEIGELASHYFNRKKFSIIAPEQFMAYVSQVQESLSDEDRDMIDELKIYLPYLTDQLRFDNSNTLSALENTGLEVPKVSSYFGRIAEYMMKLNNP
jgi:thioester reductase-like protein